MAFVYGFIELDFITNMHFARIIVALFVGTAIAAPVQLEVFQLTYALALNNANINRT